MRKTKVLHITFDMRIGGTEMVIKNIIEDNQTEAFEMSIFCIEEPIGPWGKELMERGLKIYSQHRSDGFDIGMIKAIRKQIKENNIDVLHCHQYTPWVYGVLASIGMKARVIFTEHGRFYPDVKSPKRRYINPILRFFTHKITAISDATAQALDSYEYIPKQDCEVVYNGIHASPLAVKTNIREKLGLNDETLLLGTIARFDPIKNHFLMLNSLRKVLDKGLNAHLIIVGDGETRQEIESTIQRLSLQDSVTLPGYVVKPNDFLHAFDVFLLTSFSEGTSMTLLEAMRASKPCIVTDVGGNPEVIKDGVNGIVIKNDCEPELSEAIIALSSDTEKLGSMQTAAKKRFDALFTAKHMCEQYQAIYDQLRPIN
ncbi:glycosyltransferase family 4 protein [Glaciecola petra]|uniref:Glycosyltransferase family 4 protein n=1 Tax=Glaciecola petra TaxID=3075602 RepID=A0ABU2ZMG5_9ALTE|nr:glycosyltransferase family 4 protein [Aestuariibacter sp. P117]MDT0593601.1 glycosyltransferase family 4 protein [Aestuariibacter sp. P117]